MKNTEFGKISFYSIDGEHNVEIIFYKVLTILLKNKKNTREIKVLEFIEYDKFKSFNITFFRDNLIIDVDNHFITEKINFSDDHFHKPLLFVYVLHNMYKFVNMLI